MRIAALPLALSLGSALFAGAEERLRLAHIGSESGLTHNSVYSVLQDRQGFLWAGTVDGLNRYDGYGFVTYRHDPGDPQSLSNPVIRCLLEDRQGALWVGTDGGLNRLDRRQGRFVRYALALPDGQPIHIVWTMLEDAAGTLWVGTDRGLFRYARAADRFVPHALAPPAAAFAAAVEVLWLDVDSRGQAWALTATYQGAWAMLHPFSAVADASAPFSVSPEWGPVYSFAIDRHDRFWIGPPAPAIVDAASRRLLRPRGAALSTSPTLAALESRDGTIWLGSGAGLFHADPESGTSTLFELGAPGGGWFQNMVRSLWEDRAGALWIGSYTGLQRYDPHAKPFRQWRHDRLDPGSLGSSVVSAILPAGSGALWIGSFGGGLDLLDLATGAARHFRNRPGDRTSLRDDAVWALHQEPDGSLWIATEAGLCTFDPRTQRFAWRDPLVKESPDGLRDARIARIARGPDGRLWLAGFTGLYSIDPATGAARRHPLGADVEPAVHAVNSVLPLADVVWAGSGALGLIRLDPRSGAVKRYPLVATSGERLQSEGIWTIHRDREGMLWLGTGAGLSRFDPERESFEHYFPRDGLPGSIVYGILEDERGRLWLGTNRGLTRFDPRASKAQRFRTYDVSDGVGTMEFNRQAALVGPGGEFFFGGIDGLVGFVPDRIEDDAYLPPVVLTAVQSSRREGALAHNPFGLDQLALSYRDYSFAFEFAALSFANPARNQYAYRLEGFERDWVAAGTNRLARYTNVPPGRYLFRVKGSNQDGRWNEAGLALPITIAPPYWQTLWFRALLAASLLALVAAAYRYRVSKLLEMERLRLRIASDLHDDLSSDLSAIAMVTDMMRRRPALEDEDRGRLAELRDKALEMADALRDTVWYVQPEHDTLEAMVRRMRSAAASLLGETPCAFEIELPLERGDVHMAARRNLFLIYKELIHNVARHARASAVSVSLKAEDGRLVLKVRDDGAGFEPGAAYAGEGLRSLRRRARQMGADLEISSRPGEGTETRVSVTLARTRDGDAGRGLV